MCVAPVAAGAPQIKILSTPLAIPGVDHQSRNLRMGERSSRSFTFTFPFLSLLSPLPLIVGLLNQLGSLVKRYKLPQWGPRRSTGRKRIRCTLKLPASHWWQ